MKKWENWSIDTNDDDITISGDSSSRDKVSITFSSGSVVSAGAYTVTYDDGERCLKYIYVVQEGTCSCTVTSNYPSSSPHSYSSEGSFIAGKMNGSCTSITITYLDAESNGDWLNCSSMNIDTDGNITSTGVSENTNELRYAKYSLSCGGVLEFYQDTNQQTCDCNSLIVNGTEEADGLKYYAKIVNNSNASINVTDVGFEFSDGSTTREEKLYNAQTILAYTTEFYNHGNSICLDSCDNEYTIVNISNFKISINDVSTTVTCDKTSIRNGDTITLTYTPQTPKATLRLSNGTTAVVPCDGDSTLKYTDMTSVVDVSQVVSVHVESCVTKIDDSAFNANSFASLTSITMENSVTEIGKNVHETSYGSTNLKTITFSSNLVSIGDNAFWGCGKLTSINLPNGLQTIGNDSFRTCSGLTTVVLPDSVKSIGDQCFYDCKKITTFTFGTGFTGVTSFGQSLQGTDALTKVTCKAITPPKIDSFMFCDSIAQQCYDRIRIYVPRNSVSAYETAPGWNRYYIDDEGF